MSAPQHPQFTAADQAADAPASDLGGPDFTGVAAAALAAGMALAGDRSAFTPGASVGGPDVGDTLPVKPWERP